jgi:hypothetical protein
MHDSLGGARTFKRRSTFAEIILLRSKLPIITIIHHYFNFLEASSALNSSIEALSYDHKTILSCRDLYQLVWSTPVTKLAEQFGISDRGLAKIGERHHMV